MMSSKKKMLQVKSVSVLSHATISYLLYSIKFPKNSKSSQDLSLATKVFRITSENIIFSTAAASGTARRDKEFKKAQKLTLDRFYRKNFRWLAFCQQASSAFSSSFKFWLWLDSNKASQCPWCFTQTTKCIHLGCSTMGHGLSQLEQSHSVPTGRAMHKCHNKHLHLGNKQQSDSSLWFTQSRLSVSTDWVNWGFVQINVVVEQCGISKLGMVWLYVYLKIQLVIMSSVSQPMKHWWNNW